jgi:hypothetical protein
VSPDTLLEGVETSASFALVSSYGGYTTNLPLEDLTDHKAWIAFRSVVSVLLRALGDFSLHPQGRPCGRPPPAAVLAPATTRRKPGNGPHQQVILLLKRPARPKCQGDEIVRAVSPSPQVLAA